MKSILSVPPSSQRLASAGAGAGAGADEAPETGAEIQFIEFFLFPR